MCVCVCVCVYVCFDIVELRKRLDELEEGMKGQMNKVDIILSL